MAQKGNKKGVDTNAAEESNKQSGSGKKTPKSLKPEPKIVKKSPSNSTPKAKKSKGSQSAQKNREASNVHENKEKNQTSNVHENKEKNQTSNAHENKEKNQPSNAHENKEKNQKEDANAKVKEQKVEGNKEKIDGMIFMCNTKTKSDCYRYMVMGLPQSKKEIVATIKPGLKLFLYDFDAKLLYGIYKATSSGGMNLERAAFNGSYPAQVRFKVHMDCLPISEGSLKKAIMGDSNGDKIKFNTELTAQQVKKLTSFFRPSHHSPQQVPTPLVPLRPVVPAIEAPPHRPYEELSASGQIETAPHDILSFGEKEYRMFGLRRRMTQPLPPTPSYPSKMESENNPSKRIVVEGEYKRPEPVPLATRPAYYDRYLHGVPRSEAEDGRLHSAHAANALSDYNRSQQQPGDRGNYDGSLPVSSRYAFAGPSFSWQRS